MVPTALAASTQRRRRALAHQCRHCRRHGAMRAVEHPSGTAILCRHCGYLARPPLAAAADGSPG